MLRRLAIRPNHLPQIGMKAILLIACMAQALAAWEPAPWTPGDTLAEAAFMAVLACDRAQTRQIQTLTKGATTIIERNPLLGPHPGRHAINDYFAICAAAHLAIAIALPHGDGRRCFQAATLCLEAWVVGNNARIGLRITF